MTSLFKISHVYLMSFKWVKKLHDYLHRLLMCRYLVCWKGIWLFLLNLPVLHFLYMPFYYSVIEYLVMLRVMLLTQIWLGAVIKHTFRSVRLLWLWPKFVNFIEIDLDFIELRCWWCRHPFLLFKRIIKILLLNDDNLIKCNYGVLKWIMNLLGNLYFKRIIFE